MTPKKIKELIPAAAKQLGVPEEDLHKIVSFYFKETKKKLANLEHLGLVVRGLGNMMIKGWDIEKTICVFKEVVAHSTRKEKIAAIEAQIKIHEEISKKWEEDRKDRKEVLRLKQEYYRKKGTSNEPERKDTACMEEQGADNGGVL